MLKNVADITNQGKQTGLNTQDNILAIDKSQSPDLINVIVRFDGSIEKRLGSNTQNAIIIANSAGPGFSPAGTLTANLQAFWRMDEPSGNRSDSFGGNTLTDVNSVPSDGGIKNRAASFVAANTQYLILNNTSTIATGDVDFSMSSWIYLNSTSPTVERSIISKKDVATGLNVVTLLHMDGANGSTTFTDSELTPKTFTANGAVTISTTQTKFGTASGSFPGSSGDNVTAADSADWDFGTGDFTIDFWVYFSTVSTTQYLVDVGNGIQNKGVCIAFEQPKLAVYVNGLQPINYSWSPSINTWYHIAVSRLGSTLNAFIDGTIVSSVGNSSDITGSTEGLKVGDRNFSTSFPLIGFMDELRIVKGEAKYTGTFTPPVAAYSNPSNPSQYEYWLYVNTDNVLTFRVSSSGVSGEGSVSATSFGALGTATWYNTVAYHDAGNNILLVGVNLSLNSATYASGVRSGSAPFVIGAVSDGATAFFDGRVDETGFWKKVLTASDMTNLYNSGSSNTYQTAFDTKPWASFDFGASNIRWLTVAAGTGVYASSNLGLNFVTIATDRTATYQYFERSKNALIATSDLYDTPLAWTGSAGTFMVRLNSNAPLTKYSINFQGFLILLNSNTRKRGFFYQDENTQLTGTWASSFDIPSTQDDEITAAFVFRKNMYVSTRYFLYRVSYVGGNPDFSFEKVKDWGYVSRTVKQVYVAGVGQVVAGLCWDGKMRFFDGSDDQIFSDNIEQDNGLCEFALDNLSFSGSGPVISFAETDYNENVYKLCIAIGALSNQTTHILNYDGRAKSFYPFNRQYFNTMVMAESGNRRFLMAFDRSGYVHMLNSGNLDGNTTPIDEHYDSCLIFEKSPAQAQKGHQTNLFFSNESSGTIYYLDRSNFDNQYTLRETVNIPGTQAKFQIHKVIDTPLEYNAYQWRITSSSGTNDPWKLQRYDHMNHGTGIGKTE